MPDFPRDEGAVDAARNPARTGIDAHSGADPFIMQLDGRAQLFVTPARSKTAHSPRTTSRSNRSCRNVVYRQQNNPTLREWRRDGQRAYNPPGDGFPYVLTTYRLTEQSGIMTRYVPWLAELQPALFVRDRSGTGGRTRASRTAIG